MAWLYRKITVIKPAQTAFESNFARIFFTGLTALFISLGAYAQSAVKVAEQIPKSFRMSAMQVDPKDLKVLYLKPGNIVTQEQLTADSLKLVKQINTYNKFQSIPNGWDGKGATPEKAYKIISDSYDNFLVDKVRYYVATGQIPKPNDNAAVANVAPGTQLKLGDMTDIIPSLFH